MFISGISQWRIFPWKLLRKSPISVDIFTGFSHERFLGKIPKNFLGNSAKLLLGNSLRKSKGKDLCKAISYSKPTILKGQNFQVF